VPASGPSFPSGHVILVAAVACVVAPNLAVAWWWLPLVLTALVLVGRVYVGAHNPLDVICGAALGLVIAGAINLVLRPRQRQTDPRAERSAIGV
jgi:undecaprenyl-diphosphatase